MTGKSACKERASLYASKSFMEKDPRRQEDFCLTCGDGDIIRPVVIVLVFDILDEVGYTPVHVVVFKVWIILDWFVVAQEVKAKSFRRTVPVKQNSGKQTLLVLIESTFVSCSVVMQCLIKWCFSSNSKSL